jgi:hypothetical protein
MFIKLYKSFINSVKRVCAHKFCRVGYETKITIKPYCKLMQGYENVFKICTFPSLPFPSLPAPSRVEFMTAP